LALDCRDLRRLGILTSPTTVAGQLDWKASPGGTLLRSATFWLGPLGDDYARELRLRLSEELDPTGEVQVFKLERVPVGCAPRWLLTCPQCGERRARRLFLPPKSTRFGCKDCHALRYRSVQQYDHRVDRIVQRLRAGDISVIEEYDLRGRRLGHAGFCSDRLFLSALVKLFPEVGGPSVG